MRGPKEQSKGCWFHFPGKGFSKVAIAWGLTAPLVKNRREGPPLFELQTNHLEELPWGLEQALLGLPGRRPDILVGAIKSAAAGLDALDPEALQVNPGDRETPARDQSAADGPTTGGQEEPTETADLRTVTFQMAQRGALESHFLNGLTRVGNDQDGRDRRKSNPAECARRSIAKTGAENGTIPAVPGIALDENHLKVPGIDEAPA